MIICAKYLMTGDGKTVLEDKAVLTKDGKIEKIASKEELTKAYPEEEVKDYGEATLLPGTVRHARPSGILLFPAGYL